MKNTLKLNFKDINPKKTLVLVVDLQNDFCHEKSVLKRKRSGNKKCALAVYGFIEKAKKHGIEIAFFQQIFDESKLTERQKKYYSRMSAKRSAYGAYKIPCKKGSFGAEYFNYNPPKNRLFVKHNFDIWQNKEFIKFLDEHSIETLIITGVEILCCVLFAVLGADERGFKIVVPRDLVSGVDEGVKEQEDLLRIIGTLYGPLVSSKEILKVWNEQY